MIGGDIAIFGVTVTIFIFNLLSLILQDHTLFMFTCSITTCTSLSLIVVCIWLMCNCNSNDDEGDIPLDNTLAGDVDTAGVVDVTHHRKTVVTTQHIECAVKHPPSPLDDIESSAGTSSRGKTSHDNSFSMLTDEEDVHTSESIV